MATLRPISAAALTSSFITCSDKVRMPRLLGLFSKPSSMAAVCEPRVPSAKILMPPTLSMLSTLEPWPFILRLCGVLLRSEEHTSELQSQSNLVCRLLLEKKKVIMHSHMLDIILTITENTHRIHSIVARTMKLIQVFLKRYHSITHLTSSIRSNSESTSSC